jgi:hypothetical protein
MLLQEYPDVIGSGLNETLLHAVKANLKELV